LASRARSPRVTNASQGKQKPCQNPLLRGCFVWQRTETGKVKFLTRVFAKNPAPSAKNWSWEKDNPFLDRGNNHNKLQLYISAHLIGWCHIARFPCGGIDILEVWLYGTDRKVVQATYYCTKRKLCKQHITLLNVSY
jgi:hypothetical protein